MARVFGVDNLLLQYEGAEETERSREQSNAGTSDLLALSRIWNQNAAIHKSSAINRSLKVDITAHRSWPSTYYRSKGYISCKPFISNETDHGNEDTDSQRPDLQSETISAPLGKGEAEWLEMAACVGAKQKEDFQIWGILMNNAAEGVGSTTVHIKPAMAAAGKLFAEGGLFSPTIGRYGNPRSAISPTDLIHKSMNHGLLNTNTDLIQIFVKSIEGKHFCMRISKRMSIHELKQKIQDLLGTPAQYQNLIYSGYSLQDKQTLQHYGINNDSTIILNLRLCGGSRGTSSKNTSSFRDAVKGKKMENKTEPPPEQPGPYIVEQKPESPTIQVTMPEELWNYMGMFSFQRELQWELEKVQGALKGIFFEFPLSRWLGNTKSIEKYAERPKKHEPMLKPSKEERPKTY